MNRFSALITKTGLFLMASLMLISGCKKDEEKTAPAIPPVSTFVMDFSGFSNADDTTGSRELATYQNWGYSFVNVVSWNALLTVGLAVPVATFRESFNHPAVFNPDANNWTWSYNITAGNSVYGSRLTGQILGDSVAWEMHITRNPLFTDFLWYSGKSAIDQSGGYWIMVNSPQNPVNLLRIDWHRTSDNIADIRYTNIVPGGPDAGSYIFYGAVAGDNNRFYNIYNQGSDNLTEIEWNAENRSGHVKDSFHFGNNLWHCWDAYLMDTQCP